MNETARIDVELYWLSQPCLIILGRTGTWYTQQTGGSMCHQQTIEGYLQPLPTRPALEAAIESISECDGLTPAHVSTLNDALREIDFAAVIAVDETLMCRSEEAWVHVTVLTCGKPAAAILTWNNSD